jgi:hypothetical protein
MEITYVPKEKICPAFGYCYADGRIEIRDDLPECVKGFVLDHEELHRDDKVNQEAFIAGELESNWGGFIRHPLGAIVTMFMSLAPYRLKYYWQRLKDKK